MLSHPLSIAIVLLELGSLYFLARAALPASRLLLKESSGNGAQGVADSDMEASSVNGYRLFIVQAVAFFLALIGISLVFPPILTGIMCGTGVLQISGDTGIRMLLVKGLLLLSLYVWAQVDLVRRTLSEEHLDAGCAKGLICTVPFVVLGVWLSIETLWALGHGQSGDCCTIAYGGTLKGSLLLDSSWLLGGLALLSILVLAYGICVVRNSAIATWLYALGGGVILVWCVVAYFAMVYFFSAYYYGVTQHHCPWCLFLPGNFGIGYPLTLAMALLLSQGAALVIRNRINCLYPLPVEWLQRKNRISGLLILAGMVVYFLVSLIPMVIWRIGHGAWLK